MKTMRRIALLLTLVLLAALAACGTPTQPHRKVSAQSVCR